MNKGNQQKLKTKGREFSCRYVEHTHYLTVVQKSLLKIGTGANVLFGTVIYDSELFKFL